MEAVSIVLGQDDAYDRAVHGDDKLPALREGGDLQFITKDHALVSGRAGICIAFSVEVDGKLRRAQATTTVRNMQMLAAALSGRYDENGMVRPHLDRRQDER